MTYFAEARAFDDSVIPLSINTDGAHILWDMLPARPLSTSPVEVLSPEESKEADACHSSEACALEPAQAVTEGVARAGGAEWPPDGRPPVLPRYQGFVKRTFIIAKIHGYEPSQLTPGYEERLAALVAGGQGAGALRRLAGVYVRHGCIELLIETEDWGTVDSLNEERDSHGDCTEADWSGAAESGGTQLANGHGVPAAPRVPRAAAGVSFPQPTTPLPPPPPPPCSQDAGGMQGDIISWSSAHAIPLNDSPAPEAASDCSAASAGGVVAGFCARPSEGALSQGGNCVACDAAAAGEGTDAGNAGDAAGPTGRRGRSNSCVSNGSNRSVDISAIIRALQLRDDGSNVSTEEDVLNSSSDLSGDAFAAAFVPKVAGAAPEARDGLALEQRPESAPGAGIGADSLRTPAPSCQYGVSHPIGPTTERQAAIQVSVLQPRVLTPRPAAPSVPGHQPQRRPGQLLQPPPAAVAPTAAGGAAAAGAAVPSGEVRPAADTTPAALLRAVVQCAADLQPGSPPSPLEVLVRSHGAYLPVRARWTRLDGAGPQPGAAEGEAEVRLAPGPLYQPVADVAARPDVNLPQLLDLELLELPARPGIALIDLRWYGRPCRTVPLLLTADPEVAAELQATISNWPRAQSELDEFLLDFGTWEFHAASCSAASAGLDQCGSAAQAALDPQSSARLAALGAHLLQYVTACNWVRTAAHMHRLIAEMGSRGVEAGGPRGVVDTKAGSSGGAGDGSGPSTMQPAPAEPPGAATAMGAATRAATATARTGGGPDAMGSRAQSAAEAVPLSRVADVSISDVGTVVGAVSVIAGGSSAAGPPARAGGPRPCSVSRFRTALALLLLATGMRSAAPEEEAAFQEFAQPWIFAQGRLLPLLDLVSLFTLLFRARQHVLNPANLTALVACCGGALTVLLQPLLPHRTWVRVVNGYRVPRFMVYAAVKCMIAFLGFPPPPGILSYATGFALLLMEGVIVPGCSMLPTWTAAAALALQCSATACMLCTCGANPSFAAIVGGRTWATGAMTTMACHAYLRACYWRRQGWNREVHGRADTKRKWD